MEAPEHLQHNALDLGRGPDTQDEPRFAQMCWTRACAGHPWVPPTLCTWASEKGVGMFSRRLARSCSQ